MTTKTKEQVLAELTARAPKLLEHIKEDRDWLWYCGPSLQPLPKVREFMKGVGFRFSGKRNAWYHPCEKPLFGWRGRKGGKQAAPAAKAPGTSDDCGDYLELMKEMLA